jgi:hypothetical protein
MTAKDIKVGQAYKWSHEASNTFLGVFLLTAVEHDADHCYVTYKRLWLYHVDPTVSGTQSYGGSPWEGLWEHELLA